MINIVDYCKGRAQWVMQKKGAIIDVYYKIDCSNSKFEYGIEMELKGEIMPKELKAIEIELKNSIPTTCSYVFDELIEAIGYYIDDPKLFENHILKFGTLEV